VWVEAKSTIPWARPRLLSSLPQVLFLPKRVVQPTNQAKQKRNASNTHEAHQAGI
jgi:hypothetical protein